MLKVRESVLSVLLAVVGPLAFQLENSWAAPIDFDGDGISDLTTYSASGKQLQWRTRHSSTQQEVDLGVFGGVDDLPVPGPWLGSGTQIGVVSLEKNAVIWSILNNGSVESKSFGAKGDLVVAGGDYNGNGVADAAVVRLKEGKAVWQIWLDPFTDPTSQPRSVTFGASGDRVFFAKVTNTTQDWIGVLRAGAAKNSQARMRNVITGEVRTLTRLPALATKGDRPRAHPVSQPGGPDLLAFHTVKANSTAIRVFSLTGVEIGNVSVDGTSEAFIGELNDGPGAEVAYQSGEDRGAFNPHLAEVRQITPLSGTLVDHLAFRTMGGVPSTTTTGSGGGAVPTGAVSQCKSLNPWPSSYIYKTVGSNHFTDVRRNTVGLVMKTGAPTSNATSCVQVLSSSGKVLISLGLYARGAGWAARYYSGIGCGSATPVNGSALASLARSSAGNSQIIMNLGGTCYGPIEATKCLNSSSC
jgi:hypothetical protein